MKFLSIYMGESHTAHAQYSSCLEARDKMVSPTLANLLFPPSLRSKKRRRLSLKLKKRDANRFVATFSRI